MSSNEYEAYEVATKLDVDYVLVIFGGYRPTSDDIGKFLWMVRIGGGVYPHIKEPDYFDPNGYYRIDTLGSETMLNCLMYKLSYYRFGEVKTRHNQPAGYDNNRQAVIGVILSLISIFYL